MRTRPIGVFTALTWEGATVRAGLTKVTREADRVWRGTTGEQEVLVITGGIGPGRTQQTVERFTHTPLAAVLSVGCAGALVPGVATGQLVLAPQVRMFSAEAAGKLESFPVDPALLEKVRAAAEREAIPVAEGSLFTSTRILHSVEEKRQYGETTGTVAVEMESGVHAAFAQEKGLPFLAVRVILDPAEMTIPVMKGVMTAKGDIRPLKAVRHLMSNPQHLSALMRLKRSQATAAQTLTKLCRVLLPLLESCFPR